MSSRNWRSSRDYRLWRAHIIRRDKSCVICNSKKRRHAHHINHATFFPDEKFDVENGVCLCGRCHSIYHNKYHGGTRKKCTLLDFMRFRLLTDYIKGLKCTTSPKEV